MPSLVGSVIPCKARATWLGSAPIHDARMATRERTMALLERLRGRLHRSLRWRTEAPLPGHPRGKSLRGDLPDDTRALLVRFAAAEDPRASGIVVLWSIVLVEAPIDFVMRAEVGEEGDVAIPPEEDAQVVVHAEGREVVVNWLHPPNAVDLRD